jgi:A/G-specific adenine glycosylase
MSTRSFSARLLAWFDESGRKQLPWQHPRTPYRVWLSEVMLQQTQVATVIPYFERFVAELPTLQSLALAPLDRVLALWSGLGYYSRARNLHRAAQRCVDAHGGELPRELEALCALPGIGRSTAAAILAQAHGARHAVLDGNVKRVLARHAGIEGEIESASVLRQLWTEAEARLPSTRLADYTQAIMDIGALVCTRRTPRCDACALARDCVALREGRLESLPQRRRARVAPTRRTAMLVLRDREGRVLLERRPPTGIWGGLWSLPECSEDAADATARAHVGRARLEFDALPAFRHVFTHFRLEVQPLLATVTPHADTVRDDPDRRWLAPDQLAGVGLPQPVRKLLSSLDEVRT